MTFWNQIRYRAKALLAGAGLIAVGVLEWVVQNPDTAKAVEQIVPAPWDQLVPIVLGGIAVTLVHQVPNTVPTVAAAITTSARVETGAGN